MHATPHSVPVVLSFSASNPTGGSGIQADIEALSAMGCHCAPILTGITTQNTTDLYHFLPCSSQVVHDQARAVLEDMPVAGFKIGMAGTLENLRVIHQLIKDYPRIPVVLDPFLQWGPQTINPAFLEAMIHLILPFVTICTVNPSEARAFGQAADTMDACAQAIMAQGAMYVLITGDMNSTHKISNAFYGNYRRLEVFHWERLPQTFQGSGCTLSACIAGLLAQGLPPTSVVHQAQQYTMACLKQAYRLGMGHFLPNRLYWARQNAVVYNAPHKKKALSS